MATKFLVWKNPACNGINPDWLFMNGDDFFEFLKSPASDGRYFVLLDNTVCWEADVIFIEATEEKYQDWYKEHCHHKYLMKSWPEDYVLSLDAPVGENRDELDSMHELVADLRINVEEAAIKSALISTIRVAISTLCESHQEAIYMKYFLCPYKTDLEIASYLGISEKAYLNRRHHAIKKLSKIVKK